MKAALAITIASALFAAGCQRQGGAPLPGASMVDDSVATEQVESLKRRALLGEIEASAAMADMTFDDDPAWRYWVQIAAENGHAVSQYNFAYLLWDHGRASEEDKLRAQFWLQVAAAQGHSASKVALVQVRKGQSW